jgi:hypothetical protein
MLWSFWIRWTLVIVASAVAGSLLVQGMVSALYNGILHSVAGTVSFNILFWLHNLARGMLGMFLVGLAIGAAQWWTLKTQVNLGRWYVPVTAISWGIVGLFANYNAISFLGGSIIGLAQWFILKRYFRQAGLWILASALAGALASVVNYQILLGLNPYAVTFGAIAPSGALFTGVSIGIYAVVTGFALIWLLQHRRRTSG